MGVEKGRKERGVEGRKGRKRVDTVGDERTVYMRDTTHISIPFHNTAPNPLQFYLQSNGKPAVIAENHSIYTIQE